MPEGVVAETWELRLSQPPSALWPLLADTNRIHEALDMPRYEVSVESEGETLKLVARSGQGPRALEWEETPFEWVAGQWWRFDRKFLKGPLARFGATLFLRKATGGGAHAQYALSAEPNGVIGKTLLSSGYLRRAGEAFLERAEAVDAFLGGRRATPFPTADASRPRNAHDVIDARAAKMAESPFAHGAASNLAGVIAEAPVAELTEIRPRRLARMLDISERAAAEACLSAVDAGLLALRFVALCPRCRRPIVDAPRLAELPEEAVCAVDGTRFPIDLAVNVEAVFAPPPEVRALGSGVFCASGPMTAPHVLIQQRLEPGERRAFPFEPRPGGYRLRIQAADGRIDGPATGVNVERSFVYATGRYPIVAAVAEGAAIGGEAPDGAIVFENHTTQPRVMSLERREWRADALTAAEITPLQAYRTLFPLDAPKTPTRAGRLTFAAFILADREAAYARHGDERATAAVATLDRIAEELARSRNGGVARRQGDRGLAAFLDPLDAIGFALDLRNQAAEVFGDGGASAAPGFALGLGLAEGRAFATARGRLLDYLGFAPALAERLAEAAAPGELAVASDIASDPDVAVALAACARRDDHVSIAGVEQNVAFVRAA